MVTLGLLLVILCYNPVLISAVPYLVSLKSTETLDTFFKYDVNYPLSQRVKALISNSFAIGNFTGFSGDFSKGVIDRLKRCPLVADLTPDIIINAFDVAVQGESPRHLARLSQREKLEGTKHNYYYDDTFTGKGVNAYVLDSGVMTEHPEFEGRAFKGKDFTREGSGDTNGHGTHVSGIIGSRSYGVSKDVNIIEIKALDKSGAGSLSTIIAAIEFAVNHRRLSGRPGVANLSLGATKNAVLNRAVNAAFETGLVIVVAAGNSNLNACITSPASASSAITVGAIDDRTDGLATFSNWGECVDIFASGTYVASVNTKDIHHPQVLSGTSMSAPIITGLVSNLLSQGISSFDVKDYIIEMASKRKINKTSLFLRKRTPNRIAYNGASHGFDTDLEQDSDFLDE